MSLDTEGGEEAGASDSLTQAYILFMTPIAQPEQVTYGSEQQQQQLMDSDCDVLITEGTAAITRVAVKCGEVWHVITTHPLLVRDDDRGGINIRPWEVT